MYIPEALLKWVGGGSAHMMMYAELTRLWYEMVFMLIELTQMRISAVIYAHLTVETEGKSHYRVHQNVKARKKNLLNDEFEFWSSGGAGALGHKIPILLIIKLTAGPVFKLAKRHVDARRGSSPAFGLTEGSLRATPSLRPLICLATFCVIKYAYGPLVWPIIARMDGRA